MPVTVEQRLDTPAILELAQLPQWVRWKLETPVGKDKPTKVPYRVDGVTPAASTRSSTWSQFKYVLSSAGGLSGVSGIGFVFVRVGNLVGVDLDGCRDPETGRIAAWAQQWIDALNSYCEVSPSGTGVKLWLHGDWPGHRHKVGLDKAEKISPHKDPAIEVYSHARYFAVTGQHLPSTPQDIRPNQTALDLLRDGYFSGGEDAETGSVNTVPPSPELSDEEILDKARNARNGSKFRALFDDGDLHAHGGEDLSESGADLALVSLLLFYTGDDFEQLDRLFCASALYGGSKWGTREDYRAWTIGRAAQGMTEFYGHDGRRNGRVVEEPAEAPADADDEPAVEEPEPPPWTPTRLISDAEREQAARDTWLDRYIAYGQLRTDAPAVFHEALGVVGLSAAVGRRGVIRLSQGPQVPSHFTLIIAPSTIYRKSTALDLLREVVKLVDSELLAPNDFTPQRFVAIMAEHDGRALVFARDEFSGFYDGLNRLDYMAGLKELLCDIYDGRDFHREKMKPKKRKADADEEHTGPVVARANEPRAVTPPDESEWKHDIREPFLSIAAGTTMDRFIEVARNGDVGSGFLVRFALVLPDGPPPSGDQEISEMTPEMEAARDTLVNDLKVLAHMDLRLRVAPEAFKRFNAYTRAINKQAMTAPATDLVAMISGRAAWMAFRTAVLLAAADTLTTKGEGLVELPHLLRGIDLAEGWRATAIRVLASLAPSRMERLGMRLVDVLRDRPDHRMTRRDASRMLRTSKKEMNDIEATLEDRGEIKIERIKGSGPQRVVYIGV